MRVHLAPVLAAALWGPLWAQDVLWERTGQAGASIVNDFAKFIGDIDGDGCDDLLMRAYSSVPQRWTPEFWFLSGRDGRTLRTLPQIGDTKDYGPAGDMDGDGTPDYVVTGRGYMIWMEFVEVRSGRDDRVILRLNNPSGLQPEAPSPHVLGGRDLTGDGRPDLVFRWVVNSAEANVGAFDHTGRRLYYHVGSWNALSYTVGSGHSGSSMGWVGDIDGDGADDFTLGSSDASLGVYVALVLSGRTGLVLRKGVTADPRAGIGWTADGCGDVDGDGVPDFVAGTDNLRNLVQVFSGRTGQTLRRWPDGNYVVGGPIRSGGVDFDRDGVPDVVFMRNTETGQGGIYVCSGRDGGWTHRLLSCPSSYGTSRSCVYVNTGYTAIDVGRAQPGNPYPVFVFQEPEYGFQAGSWPLGRIRMYRSTPVGVEPFGTACAGTLPAPPQMGIRDLQGRATRLLLTQAPPGGHAALLLGLSRTQWNGIPLPMPLAPFGFPGCSLFTSVDVLATTWAGSVGLDRGYASIDLPLPLRPPGQEMFTLHGQWLVLDALTGGVAASDAILWRH